MPRGGYRRNAGGKPKNIDMKLLVEMRKAGKLYKQLADHFNVNIATITRRLKSTGLVKPRNQVTDHRP